MLPEPGSVMTARGCLYGRVSNWRAGAGNKGCVCSNEDNTVTRVGLHHRAGKEWQRTNTPRATAQAIYDHRWEQAGHPTLLHQNSAAGSRQAERRRYACEGSDPQRPAGRGAVVRGAVAAAAGAAQS